MARMETHVKGADVLFIENGTRRKFRIPRFNLSRVENVSGSPGKRETSLDIGILTPSLFTEMYDAKFVRRGSAPGELIFDLTYKNPPYEDTTRQRVWVDSQKRYTTKREWYAQDGHLKAVFLYEDPKLQNGVWFPSMVTIKNGAGGIAGVVAYTNVRVNTGLSDQLFKL
jgi:outer membrane lipoprotein-sorting protein